MDLVLIPNPCGPLTLQVHIPNKIFPKLTKTKNKHKTKLFLNGELNRISNLKILSFGQKNGLFYIIGQILSPTLVETKNSVIHED